MPANGSHPRLLALEPYYGGSHRAVLDGLLERLSEAGWEHDLLTLPARKWKWRMRGSAVTMADEVAGLVGEVAGLADEVADSAGAADVPAGDVGEPGGRSDRWDVVFASTFIDLASFRGLAGRHLGDARCVVYFHENQLVYPVRVEREWDLHFPLTNVTGALAADRCLFNTRWNLERFLGEIPALLGRFPDHLPERVPERIAERSRVLPPPFDGSAFDAHPPSRGERCRIVWPHRWEHDKDPWTFFDAVERLAGEDLDFEVVVLGQAFRDTREEVEHRARGLGERVAFIGEPEDRAAYARLLASSDVAVSTARNEFFGLAMIEAAYAGCRPLVPDRLAYPEVYPEEYRYGDTEELVARLRSLVLHRPEPMLARGIAERFTFDALMPEYVEELLGLGSDGG